MLHVIIRRAFAFAAFAGIASLAVVAGQPSARAAAPRFSDIMPLSQVKAGMKGYGLTVFHGTKIEKFEVTVVGVVKDGSLIVPGHDMILVRMAGGPITERHAYLIHGMSGSPVYINGKIIGAFSQGEPNTKEPLGGVTPIEDMLEAWDPKLPSTPQAWLGEKEPKTITLQQPLQIGDRRIAKLVYNVPMSAAGRLYSHDGTVVMHPCTTFASFGSASRSAYEKLKAALAPYNVELMQGAAGARKPDFKGAPLVPGAAFSMMLVTGDFPFTATGTVAYRKGNRILGFGHPFLGIGPIDAPLASAWIYDVYPLLSASRRDGGSYKISSPGPVVGASTQDRNFAISGELGKMPKLIPVTVDVVDKTTGRSKVFHSSAVTHPSLYAALVSASVGAAISEIRSIPGSAMARVTTSVDAEEIGKISRTNVVFDARGIDGAATADLDDLLGILTGNPFYPLGLKSANVKVEIESGRETAQVDRIFLKEGKFAPGETAEVGVVIKPYKQPAITRVVKMAIPANTPSGRYVLLVKGGAVPPALNLGGLIIRQSGGAGELAPPASVRQMVDRYEEKEKNNELVTRLILPSTAVSVEGERLSNLPPSLDAVMRSAKSSGVHMERDEVKVVQPTDWVISGQQVLTINVQRKEMQEGPSSGNVGSAAPGTTAVGTTGNPAAFDQEQGAQSQPAPAPEDDGQADSVISGNALAVIDRQDPDKKPDGKKAADKKNGKKPDANAAKTGEQATPQPGVPATTTTAPADSAEKPVGRSPLTWRQTSRADFAKGEANGVGVTTGGELVLTRSLTRLTTSGESFLWSLVPDGKGGLYAGTGTQARILHIDATGGSALYVRLPEVSVQSLCLAADGALWAATGPHGRTYRITPDGKYAVAFEAPEKYALALAGDAKGNIYVGTGGGKGNVYRIAPDGKAGLFFKTPEEHVLCLATDAAGNVYAGTSSAGIVYRIAPDGKGQVLYDAPEASISAVGVTSKGDVYAATAPRGVIYRIARDGTAKTVFDKATSAYTSLRVGADDTVYAAGGSAIYAIRSDDTVMPFVNPMDIDILALAVGADSTVYAGTGNVAEVYAARTRAASAEGSYESVVHDAKRVSQWGSVRWTAAVPANTSLTVQTRTGNVAEPDSSWSAWSAPAGRGESGKIANPPARFIQYRVVLKSDTAAATPALRDIAINYLPKNLPPKVAFSAPAGGERWSKQQTIKWDASDPDKDSLSYEIYYSSDQGATWQPLPAAGAKTTTVTVPSTTAGGPASVPLGSGPPTVAAVQAELDKHPDLPASLRDAVLQRARKVNADFAAGHAGGTVTPAAGTSAAVTRETTRSIDTKLLPDGTYLLKVVSTDRPSNPADPRTSEAISEPFTVCNTAPTVVLLSGAIKLNADHSVTLPGMAVQQMVGVTAVQYRVDNGEWIAAVPADGVFDGTVENFTLSTAPLTPGSHTIEVKAFNAANATATEKITVDVK